MAGGVVGVAGLERGGGGESCVCVRVWGRPHAVTLTLLRCDTHTFSLVAVPLTLFHWMDLSVLYFGLGQVLSMESVALPLTLP